MISPQIDVQITNAFNGVLRLSGENVVELEQSLWTLQGLFRRHSVHSLAGLGLMHAYEMLGRRDDAVALSEELWGRRRAMTPVEHLNFAVSMSSLGLFARATELAGGDDDEFPPAFRHQRSVILTDLVIDTWDSELFAKAAWQSDPACNGLLRDLEQIGLLPFMSARQKVINAILSESRCHCEASIGTDGHTGTILSRQIYVNCDAGSRDRLYGQLHEAEGRFYNEHGIDIGDASWLVTEVLLPVCARGPAGENATLAAA